MLAFIFEYLIYVIPVGVLLFFIVSLAVYLKAKKSLSGSAEEKDIERLKKLKSVAKVSGIIAAVFTVIVIICTGLFFLMIAYM